jgi:hypothetical protein
MPACPEGQTYDRTMKKCRAKKSPGRKAAKIPESNLNHIWVARLEFAKDRKLVGFRVVLADSKESLELKMIDFIKNFWEDSDKYSSQHILDILHEAAPVKTKNYMRGSEVTYDVTRYTSRFEVDDEGVYANALKVVIYQYDDRDE